MPYFKGGGGIGSDFVVNTITIASGQTTSSALDLQAQGVCGFLMPAAFTGTTITFSGSADDVTYGDLYNTSDTQFSVTVAASRYFCVNPGDFLGVRYLKFVSGSAEGGERTINVMTRSLM